MLLSFYRFRRFRSQKVKLTFFKNQIIINCVFHTNYQLKREYDGWYQDANGEWVPAEESLSAAAAQAAKPANGSVVKPVETAEATSASKASSQVSFY